jgi:hypothetical protein
MGLLAGALALGCGEQQSATAPVAPPATSLRAERTPFFVGFWMGGDPSSPLALLAGFDAGVTAEDLCADPERGVEGAGQAILTAPGGFLAHASGRDVNLIVYQFAEGPVASPCQLVGAPVLGIGTGKFTFILLDTGPGGTVIHVTVQGTIDLVGGGQARLLATVRVTILPDGTLLFDEERVRLTPL